MTRAIILALALLWAGQEAGAHSLDCLPYNAATSALKRAGKIPSDRGLSHGNEVLQLFKSLDGGAWTLVIITPQGVACRLATGRDWQTITPKEGPGT